MGESCPVPRIFLAFSLVGILLVGAGCEHRKRSEGSTSADVDTSRRSLPKHVSWDAEFTMLEEGRRRAILKAPRMEQYTASDSSYSVWHSKRDTVRVRAFLFDPEGDSSATLTADSLVFEDGKGRLNAYGNVVVVSQSNKRLQSEHLVWKQADRTIRTRRFVRIVTPKEVVQGNGLVAQEDLETYQIGRFAAEVDIENKDENSDEPEN